MDNPFLAKMRTLEVLPEADEEHLRQICARATTFLAGSDIVLEGDAAAHVWVILSGLACRYKTLSNGTRQIVAFLVPGDVCDPGTMLLDRMDHGIAVNAEASVAAISRQSVQEIYDMRPALTRALHRDSAVGAAVLREWLLNNGRRDAYPRIAHLLWELYLRHRAIGQVTDHAFELRLTQRDLADATSLSHVHVSRTLSRLKREGIIEWTGKLVQILKSDELVLIADFDPNYLVGGASGDPGRLTAP